MTPDQTCFKVKIDDSMFEFGETMVTGHQLLTIAHKHPLDEHIIYQKLKDGQFEEIRLEESVDLSQPGLERFKTFRSAESYRFTVDGRKFEWGAPVITGRRLKKFADVAPDTYDVWMNVRGKGEDQIISNREEVRLDTPGLERFYTEQVSITIIINGRPHEINKRSLSFTELVQLAFPNVQPAPNTIHTIVFKNGPEENPQGSLVEGQTIIISERMIINVTKTDKS
ncbi:multiubiquitin domain-containing protein [Desulfovibrio sp. JC010]|uniref:multiubiquitin domain-containing protein n=1 Tax=Desulfovibrio sp. JC010 TaxID=2593641 RepID=UPI0013D72C80|nr:multiubiquitin domain-containing protein [Desulfovibrio sp. JC010]NDV25971.1 hypothetical protein [Desulfovibrio sp. JC010]